MATVSFQNQGYKPLPWEQRQRETSVNQETSGGRLPSLSLVELPVLYIQLFSWLHSFGSASPVNCHQESHQKPSTPISFLVLEWAGPWHSLPNPDLLGFPTSMVSSTCEPLPGTRQQKQAAHLGAPGFLMGTFSQHSSDQLKKMCRWRRHQVEEPNPRS